MGVAGQGRARRPANSLMPPHPVSRPDDVRNQPGLPAAVRAPPAAVSIWPVSRLDDTASRPGRSWLVPVGVVIIFGGVGGGVLAEGLPAGVARLIMVGLLIVAAACWAVGLSERIRDLRAVVPALVGLGLCGAGLDWPQSDGLGFVIGYVALAGLALRAPRQTALLAGAPIVTAIAASEAHESENPVSTVLAVVLGTGFLFVTSALAAFSRDAHHRAEALLAQEAAIREAREQMATLAERSRLARELHDVLAHCLSGLSVQLESARLVATATAADVSLVDQITHAHRLARNGMHDARRALQALRGDEIPGPSRIPRLVSETASALSIPITLHVEGTPRPLAPEAGLTAYRTVQEALTNVAKHGGAGAVVTVLLTWGPNSLDVLVSDRGGDGEKAELLSSGFGLTSMAERAALHGGHLEAGPSDGGFTVHLRLPLVPMPRAERS
jgi:signal transduction histidine kinase